MPEKNPDQLSGSPEQDQIDSNMLQLHDAMQRVFADPQEPIASLQSQQERLRSIIDQAKRAPGDLIGEIEGGGELIDFIWFGPGVVDEVPTECSYDGDCIKPSRAIYDLTTMLGPYGLDELIEERQRWFEHNEAIAVQAFREYMSATPLMNMLDSFRVPAADPNLDNQDEEAALNNFRQFMEEFMETPDGDIYLDALEVSEDGVTFKSQTDESWAEEPYIVAYSWVSEHSSPVEFSGEIEFLTGILINAYEPGVTSFSRIIEDAFSTKSLKHFIDSFTKIGYASDLEEALLLKQLPAAGNVDVDGAL